MRIWRAAENWNGFNGKEVVLWKMTVVANEVVLSKTVGGLSPTATWGTLNSDQSWFELAAPTVEPLFRGTLGSLILKIMGLASSDVRPFFGLRLRMLRSILLCFRKFFFHTIAFFWRGRTEVADGFALLVFGTSDATAAPLQFFLGEE